MNAQEDQVTTKKEEAKVSEASQRSAYEIIDIQPPEIPAGKTEETLFLTTNKPVKEILRDAYIEIYYNNTKDNIDAEWRAPQNSNQILIRIFKRNGFHTGKHTVKITGSESDITTQNGIYFTIL
jgi:hypothetical protein